MHDTDTISAILGGGLLLIFFIINIFFCWSLYSAMKLVPKEKQVMPDWLCWLILIPFIGIIFSWIILPFSLPKSLEAAVAGNPPAETKAKGLFGLGLAQVILMTLSIIPILGIVTGIAAFIIWIIYWIRVVEFKKTFLQPNASNFPRQTPKDV